MKEGAGQRKLTVGLFIIYGIALVWIIVFKFQLSFDTLPNMRTINLIPFYDADRGVFSLNHERVYNLLVFIPYGIYLSMLKRGWTFVKKLAVIGLTSLLFEVVQYIFAIGASDINDLLQNTLGGAVGIGVYFVFSKIFKRKSYTVMNVLALLATVGMLAIIAWMSTFVMLRF